MENNTFTYQYSAERNKEVEKIRKKYMPHEESKLERLRRLDRQVEDTGVIESLCLGIVGSLVFGIGMCFFLEVFVGAAWLCVPFFILGAAMMIPAYPMYKRMTRKMREKLAPEIIQLSEELMKS